MECHWRSSEIKTIRLSKKILLERLMNIEEKKINPAIPLTEEERILLAKVDEHVPDLIKLLQEMVNID